MGKNHKQAQRTKNNARPSSSSHSAELLGNTIPAFVGFSSVKDGMSAVSNFQTDELSINSDFQIIFKQMNKKDPTTRFKALQAFADLCNKAEINAVKAVLPLWPRMYCILCTDINHKVRESAHHAHHVVVTKVKKSIAPYLKELAGPWFTSQYDTYPPAASAATQAFEEAFPSTKLNKAILFCQEEILSYIYDNLINQTPQTLSNPNTTSPEDVQAKYERIVVASLQGYILYLQKLSSDQIQEAEESNRKLLSNAKFWKYSKNKEPMIRSCFYHTLIALCQKAVFLLQGESSRLSSAIFNNLDESDPVVLHAVWDAALNVLVLIQDCWSHANIEKQVFAKLNMVLKNGGRNVLTIYPNILPLLSKVPEDLIKDKEKFYENLFDSMRRGFEVNNYGQSPSDLKIAASTFIECLKYVILRNSTDTEFCLKLVRDQLLSSLKENLFNKKQSAQFLIQTSSLVHYWYKTESPTYKKLIEDFFTSLCALCTSQLDAEVSRESLTDVLNHQTEFLMILLNPSQYAPKSKGVKFEEDDNMSELKMLTPEPSDADFVEDILPFVRKLSAVYFKNTIDKEEKSYIIAINKLLKLFDPKEIFEEILIAVDESTYFKLFTSYFSKWLMNEDMKCAELVDLVFSLLKHVTNDEKEYILEEFCSNWFSDSLQYNVCEALPNYCQDDCVMRWVRSERFKMSVVKLVERFIDDCKDDKVSRDVIVKLMQAKCSNGDFIIEPSTVDSIMELLRKTLVKGEPKGHVLELCQELISLARSEQIKQNPYEELVASLFKLWCYYPENADLTHACKTGLHAIVTNSLKKGKRFEFTEDLFNAIMDIIVSDKIKFSPEQIVGNINTYIELAVNTNLNDSSSSNDEIAEAMEIVKMLVEKKPDWGEVNKMLEKCNRVGFEGSGDVDFEYLKLEKDNRWEQYPEFDINAVRKYVKWNLYLGSVLNLIAGAHPRTYKTSALYHEPRIYMIENNSDVIAEGSEDIILVKISKDEEAELERDLELIERVFHESDYDEQYTIEPLLDNVTQFLVSVGLMEAFNKYYASTEHYKELKDAVRKLKTLACDLLQTVNLVEFKFIYDHCRIFIRRQSLWWLIKSTLTDVFHRNFLEPSNESTMAEDVFEEMKVIEIRRTSPCRRDYLNLFALIVGGFQHRFTENQWEQVFLYLNDFFEEFLPKINPLDSDLLTLSCVARLCCKLLEIFKENHTKPVEARLPPETCLAWNEVVRTEVYDKVLETWKKLAKLWNNQADIRPEYIIVMQNVSDVVIEGLTSRKSVGFKDSVELEVECGMLMTSCHAVIQITAFRLCLSLIPDLLKLDTEMFGDQVTQMFQDKDAKDAKDTSAVIKESSHGEWTTKKLENYLLHNQGIVETLLSDFIVGDCCIVEPFTDSFTYTYSYLLLWCFLLDMCADSLQFQYNCWFEEDTFSTTLLESVFKLMPQTVLHGAKANEKCQKYFESYGSLDFREPVESERIERMACFVYRLFLQRLPTVVRQWWSHVENKTSNLVEKVTRLYVSPILIANEFKNVQQGRETGFDNLEVKIYPSRREVVATYTVEEVKMDLIMTLPQNYPLRTVKIESSNVAVSTSKWRNWLFHICRYLIHENGTIWDALVIWKTNLDKKFEGIEECYICFSILQSSSFETPRLTCHTCKKKFHSNCLYKWFSTSNRSTCPICRNLF